MINLRISWKLRRSSRSVVEMKRARSLDSKIDDTSWKCRHRETYVRILIGWHPLFAVSCGNFLMIVRRITPFLDMIEDAWCPWSGFFFHISHFTTSRYVSHDSINVSYQIVSNLTIFFISYVMMDTYRILHVWTELNYH